MIRLTCPTCGTEADADAFAADVDARRAIAAAGDLPPVVARAALGYIRLFRAGDGLRLAKIGLLLREIGRLVSAGTVQREPRGAALPCGPDLWAQAMVEMLDDRAKLRLPLQSHSYLCHVAYGLAQAAQALHEAEREERRQRGERQAEPGLPPRQAALSALMTELMTLRGRLDDGLVRPDDAAAKRERIAALEQQIEALNGSH